jgi:hypothetical protein
VLLEAHPQSMHSLSAFWWWLGGDAGWAIAAAAVSAVAVIGFVMQVWRSATMPIGYAAMLLGVVLVSPHLYAYDLVILVPSLAIAAAVVRSAAAPERMWFAIGVCAVLPALERVVAITHVQWSVLAWLWLLVELSLLSRPRQREPTVE